MKRAVALATSLPLLVGDLPPAPVDAFKILDATASAFGATWSYDYDSRALEVQFNLEQDPDLLRTSCVLDPVPRLPGIDVRVTDRWQALVRAKLPTSDDGKQTVTTAVARVTEMLAMLLSSRGFIDAPTSPNQAPSAAWADVQLPSERPKAS